ncbi:MAG: T9SS type A sorting domain-containing protein [Bacteroidota bacterium]
MSRNRPGVRSRSTADFAWSGPVQHTRGSVNRNQTFAAPGAREAVATEAAPVGLDLSVYPNPVRDRATVAVDLPEVAGVRAEVFDALGRRVATVEAGRLGAGFQSVPLDLGAVPAGLYIVRVTVGGEVATQTITVVR